MDYHQFNVTLESCVFSTVSSEDLQVDGRVCIVTWHLSCASDSQTCTSVYSSTLSYSSSLPTSSAHWMDLKKKGQMLLILNFGY